MKNYGNINLWQFLGNGKFFGGRLGSSDFEKTWTKKPQRTQRPVLKKGKIDDNPLEFRGFSRSRFWNGKGWKPVKSEFCRSNQQLYLKIRRMSFRYQTARNRGSFLRDFPKINHPAIGAWLSTRLWNHPWSQAWGDSRSRGSAFLEEGESGGLNRPEGKKPEIQHLMLMLMLCVSYKHDPKGSKRITRSSAIHPNVWTCLRVVLSTYYSPKSTHKIDKHGLQLVSFQRICLKKSFQRTCPKKNEVAKNFSSFNHIHAVPMPPTNQHRFATVPPRPPPPPPRRSRWPWRPQWPCASLRRRRSPTADAMDGTGWDFHGNFQGISMGFPWEMKKWMWNF